MGFVTSDSITPRGAGTERGAEPSQESWSSHSDRKEVANDRKGGIGDFCATLATKWKREFPAEGPAHQ